MRAVLIGFILSSAFLAVGCKQGNGDRCVQNSDCSSGICVGASVQGGRCAANTTIETGTGGSNGTGGQSGAGGEAGQGGGGAGDAGGAAGEGGAAGQDAAPVSDAAASG
ncbi:MAG TPA: hypothetical protein VHM31_19905 [Polyangia bacterium]|nr:hypothetical protein [Polyangia bacterium]